MIFSIRPRAILIIRERIRKRCHLCSTRIVILVQWIQLFSVLICLLSAPMQSIACQDTSPTWSCIDWDVKPHLHQVYSRVQVQAACVRQYSTCGYKCLHLAVTTIIADTDACHIDGDKRQVRATLQSLHTCSFTRNEGSLRTEHERVQVGQECVFVWNIWEASFEQPLSEERLTIIYCNLNLQRRTLDCSDLW